MRRLVFFHQVIGSTGILSVNHIDEKGLTACGGAAHDLLANVAGRRAMAHFRAWMEENGHTLESIGLGCIRKLRGTE